MLDIMFDEACDDHDNFFSAKQLAFPLRLLITILSEDTDEMDSYLGFFLFVFLKTESWQ